MRAILLVLAPLLLTAGDWTFEVHGRVAPPARAAAGLHATASPFAVSTLVNVDGRFRFKNVRPGMYTLEVFLLGRGEIRRTIDVGPGSADERGRVMVHIDSSTAPANPDRGLVIRARELSISKEAKREYEKAATCQSKHDHNGAVRHLQRAVELSPQFAAAWNNLGTIAYKSREYAEAESYFRRALEGDPDSYEPLVNLGGVLLNLGQIEEARGYNFQAVARLPLDPLAQVQLGMTYLRLNRLDLAEVHLMEARRLDPKHFSAPQLVLADLYIQRGEPGKAAVQVTDFLQQHPDWPDRQNLQEAVERWSR